MHRAPDAKAQLRSRFFGVPVLGQLFFFALPGASRGPPVAASLRPLALPSPARAPYWRLPARARAAPSCPGCPLGCQVSLGGSHTHLMLRGRPRAHGGALSLPPGSTLLCACGGADFVTAVQPLRQAFAPPTPLCNPRRSRVEKLDSEETTTLQAMTLCAERLWRATSPLRRPVYTISW